MAVFGTMSIFGLIASENPDGLESTFERISEMDYNLNILETSIFGFPEGLGWAILQMAIVMIIIFLLLLSINFIVYLVKKNHYKRLQEENEIKSLCGDEQIFEPQGVISSTENNCEKDSPINS